MGFTGFRGDLGEDWSERSEAVLVRYGMCNLVEGRFCRPSVGRGVFGLSGGRSDVPMEDLPVKSCCIVVRTLSNLEDGALGERLEIGCLMGGMTLEYLIYSVIAKFLDFLQVLIVLNKETTAFYSSVPERVPNINPLV